MSCEAIGPALVGFQFGVLEPSERTEVERHLVECPRCLGEFLSLKRDLELSEDSAERPRESARRSLRAAMASELGLTPRRTWWERPLAVGLAAAAVIVAILSVESIATTAPRTPVGLVNRSP